MSEPDTDTDCTERVHCPECGTTTTKETVEAAVEVAENHDEQRHDGERTALVNGMLPPSDELAEAAKEAVEFIKGERDTLSTDGEQSKHTDKRP